MMVGLMAIVARYEIDFDSKTKDLGLYPVEKNDTLFNAPEKEALKKGIPVTYGDIDSVNSSEVLGDLNYSGKMPLIVSITPVMDGFGKDRIGIIKKYQYGTKINQYEYSAPEFYNIESYNSYSVVLKKDDLGIEGQMAWTAFAWIMGETFLVLFLIAANLTPVKIKEETKKELSEG